MTFIRHCARRLCLRGGVGEIARRGLGLSAAVGGESRGAEEAEGESLYPPSIPAPHDIVSPTALTAQRLVFAEQVKQLATPQEKIEAVSPYERPWTLTEHYRYSPHRTPLHVTRKAFRIHGSPLSYNILPCHQYVTRTKVIDSQLPKLYDDISLVPAEFRQFEGFTGRIRRNHATVAYLPPKRFRWIVHFGETKRPAKSNQRVKTLQDLYRENIQEILSVRSREESEGTKRDLLKEMVDSTIHSIFQVYSPTCPHLRNAQAGLDVRQESFWVRGGYLSLYNQEDWKGKFTRTRIPKQTADDRRRLGELAFCYREIAKANIRIERPLSQIVPMDDQLCMGPVAPYVYGPKTLGLKADPDILWQTSGFEPGVGDPCEFTLLNIYNSDKIIEMNGHWQCDVDERIDNYIAAGIAHSFSNLVAQAHALGFTQYNDITYPMVTQTVLTNTYGEFFLMVYQLNSLALINHWEEGEGRANVCWYEGPFYLWGEEDIPDLLNPHGPQIVKGSRRALELLVKFALNPPSEESEGQVLRPYIPEEEIQEIDIV